MKKIHIALLFFLFVVPAFTLPISYCSTDTDDVVLEGEWIIDRASVERYINNSNHCTLPIVSQNSSPTYIVHVNPLPVTSKHLSYGAALNLKYFSGLSYDYLRKRLAGKTISLDVFIPKESISFNEAAPNKLRISIKSESNGRWVEYYGDHEFTSIRNDGHYKLTLKIPGKPIETKDKNIFNPEDTVLFLVEYYVIEGSTDQPSISFYFSDFRIEGLDLNPEDARWQFTEKGNASQDVFVPAFVKGSTFISSLGKGADFKFRSADVSDRAIHKFSGNLKNKFLIFSVFVPKELCFQPGTLSLAITGDHDTAYTTINDFHSCNLDGKVFLTLPLDSLSVSNNIEEIGNKFKIQLFLNTQNPHISDMMPLIIEPMAVRTGRLIPFDNKWKLRNMQNLTGSKDLTVREDSAIGDSPLTVKKLAQDLYQLDATMRLQGGINWDNPLYRIELMRNLENEPVDLGNQRVEVLINPLTDTTNVWQKPYRARIGLLDVNGNVMFGPNVSLSEGMNSVAYLDVSTTNPIPKGFVMPKFDPRNIRAVLVNFEASHALLDPVDIKVSLVDLMISPREYARISPFEVIDFAGFKRDPASWQLGRTISDAGGFIVGMNYPFPTIKIPKDIMEVPQIYPGIGVKINDARHLGYSSELTKETMIRDFKYLVSNNIGLVRIFVLGYLDGVFRWDERGVDIAEFGTGRKELMQKLSKMDVKSLARFLNDNENTVFTQNASGTFFGFNYYTMKDLIALLDILEQVEKDTGRRLTAAISLHDFLVADGIRHEGPWRKYAVGEHTEIITDPVIRVEAEALLWKMMKMMSRDERFYKYIALVEAMNEPENATAVVTRKNFVDLVNFVDENIYLIKDAIGPAVPVTIGTRSWPPDLQYWAVAGKGIDALVPHYWRSFESYNIDSPGLWPLDTPVGELWKRLGSPKGKRLTGMGEISPVGDLQSDLFRMEKAGYDFVLVWSYSGHDGHDAKPAMGKISQYQSGNLEFGRIKRLPRAIVEKAFTLLASTFRSIKEGGTEPSTQEILARLVKSPDVDVRKAAEEILEVIRLKNIPISEENLSFLRNRALS